MTLHLRETRSKRQLTGTAVYETAGPNYDFAQAELQKTKPGKKFKGVVVFTVHAVYDQTRGPKAGAPIWSETP
jgi:predicted pyridoxine 5'-phosphate oxidase superfamily flavin-nucleotide-binding protein